MNRLAIFLLLFSLAFSGAEAQASPSNDLCVHAESIGEGEIFGTTAGAMNEGTSTCDNENAPDVWYRYDGPVSEDGWFYFDTVGSSFDTVVSIHASCPENSSSRRIDCSIFGCNEFSPALTCNDDAIGDFAASGVQVQSQEIFIRVTGSHPAAAGDFRLRVGEAAMISGRVTDRISGAPLAEVIVRADQLHSGVYAETLTDARGLYSLESMRPGTYRLKVQNAFNHINVSYDDQPGGGPVSVRVGDSVVGVDFQLDRRARVSGRVLDRDSGEPIAGVVVRPRIGSLSGTPDTTDADGQYTLWLDTGSHRLEARAATHRDGFYPSLACAAAACDERDQAGAEAVQVSRGEVLTDLDIRLERRGGFSGRISDEADGTPVVDAKVGVYSNDGTLLVESVADLDGIYDVGGLDAGDYFTLVLSDSHRDELRGGLACPDGRCDPLQATPIILNRDERLENIGFELDRWAVLSGQVKDVATGEPIAGVRVSFSGETVFFSDQLETDDDGRYTLAGVPAGRYWAKAEPYYPSTYVGRLFGRGLCPFLCDIEQSESIEVEVGVDQDGLDFELFVGGQISGRVLSLDTDSPIPFASVRAMNGLTASLDNQGHYELIGLPPGRFELSASAPGYVTESSDGPIEIDLGDLVGGVDFLLDKTGGLSGFVRTASGTPLMDVTVSLFAASGEFLTAGMSDANGLYAFPDLRAGTYFVVAGDNDRLPRVLWETRDCPPFGCRVTEGTPIEVETGVFTRGIDFTMAGQARISGTLTDAETGMPLAGVRVDVWNEWGWPGVPAFSDAAGRYALEVTPGSYTISTDNGDLGGISELFDDFACLDGSALLGLCALGQVPPVILPTNGDFVADFDLRVDQACDPGPDRLCLGENGRFQVTVDWLIGDRGDRASAVRLTQDSGYFWFFNADNIELVVKVLDGCSLAGNRFWVFAGGLTDVGTTLTVTDTWTGEIQVYRTPAGTPFQPILDTRAFDTCSVTSPHGSGIEMASFDRDLTTKAKSLDLNGSRFRVEVDWSAPGFGTGQAEGIRLTNDSGYFWFFNADNVEIVVKVLNGCREPQETYWVFAAGLTDVEARLRVTDTLTGEVREYFSAQGEVFQPILDTQAFATCP